MDDEYERDYDYEPYDTIRCSACEALPGRCNCNAGYVPCM